MNQKEGALLCSIFKTATESSRNKTHNPAITKSSSVMKRFTQFAGKITKTAETEMFQLGVPLFCNTE